MIKTYKKHIKKHIKTIWKLQKQLANSIDFGKAFCGATMATMARPWEPVRWAWDWLGSLVRRQLLTRLENGRKMVDLEKFIPKIGSFERNIGSLNVNKSWNLRVFWWFDGFPIIFLRAAWTEDIWKVILLQEFESNGDTQQNTRIEAVRIGHVKPTYRL